MGKAYWILTMGLILRVWTVTVSLEPFQTTPHIKLCNIQQDCEDIVLIIDTGSTDLWLSDVSCKACPKKSVKCLPQSITHNMYQQSPGKMVQLKQKQIQYGIGWVKGYEIDYEICGMNTKVLCVTTAKDIDDYASHGVLGIGGNSTGKQFLLRLIESFNTTKAISIFYGAYFTQLTLGGYNYDYIKKGEEIQYYGTTVDWTLQVSRIKIGPIEFGYRIVGLVDSGSSLIVLPETMFDQALGQISKSLQQTCSKQQFGIVCACPDPSWIQKFPVVQVFIVDSQNSSNKYSIQNNLYVSWNKGLCIAQLTSLKKYDGIIILGRPFLKQYITVFDMQLNRIGLVEADLSLIRKSQRFNMGFLLGLLALITGLVSVLVIKRMIKEESRFSLD